MSLPSSSSSPQYLPLDPRIYCETINELHSYITSSKRGYLTQAELFRYYRQRHDNAEIPYRLLGYRSLLDLLSSDQRLFAIDLRREPAYIYSAVKLRQEKRERRQGTTSFSRQHHSTNTLDDDNSTTSDYVFFDHHVPLHEQQQQQHQEYNSTPDGNQSATTKSFPIETENSTNTNQWETPINDVHRSSLDSKISPDEESYEETSEYPSNPCLSVPQSSSSSMFNESSQLNQRKSFPSDDLIRSSCSSSHLNRSISTSTTTLNKTYPFQFVDLYLLLCTLVVSFVFLGFLLYKIC